MPKVNEKFYCGYFILLGEVLVIVFGHGLSKNVYHSEKRVGQGIDNKTS